MRASPLIDALMRRGRREVLCATLLQPERAWYAADLARHLRVTPSSLQRELARLTRAGVLKSRREGCMVYFQADTDCPIYPELHGLLSKTAGLGDVLREALAPVLRMIQCAFVFGSIARREERSHSDIDLMIIGSA
ncbi:MAG TPA: hypothetical protein VFC78_23640 [Tepidisphaeraceae bacterium]|nr:hypothetical protein [Tepidisphaeraceae bacterium]